MRLFEQKLFILISLRGSYNFLSILYTNDVKCLMWRVSSFVSSNVHKIQLILVVATLMQYMQFKVYEHYFDADCIEYFLAIFQTNLFIHEKMWCHCDYSTVIKSKVTILISFCKVDFHMHYHHSNNWKIKRFFGSKHKASN